MNDTYPNLDQTTHGEAGIGRQTPEYKAWADMRKRCLQPSYINWLNYGGRGIKISPLWNDYPTFLRDMGRKPGPEYTLDRLDSNSDYGPGLCRWATPKQQAQNRKTSLIVDGKCLKQRCEEKGFNYKTVWMRLKRAKAKTKRLK